MTRAFSGTSYVYLITHVPTGRRYVGKTNDPTERWGHHRRAARKGPTYAGFSKIHAAIREYGIEQFSFEILNTYNDEESAFDGEAWWIAFLGSNIRGFGFNLDSGGTGGKFRSEETREKLRRASLANPSRYWLGKNVTEAMRQSAGWSKGKTWTEAQRAACLPHIEAKRGKSRPPEVGEKVSKTLTGRKRGPMPESWREAISEAHRRNPMPTERVRERAVRGWETRRANEAAKKLAGTDN